MTLSSRIRAARARVGWTQQQLADHVGVGRQTVNRWESLGHMPQTRGPRIKLERWLKKIEREVKL